MLVQPVKDKKWAPQLVRRRPPPAPFEKSVAQKSSVSRPHSIEPPSSTDQSKGASPNSLSFVRTQLISDSPCEAVGTLPSAVKDGCSGEATAG
jgi:hypothetical protein